MATLQENAPRRVRRIAETAGVQFQPGDLEISAAELGESLSTLRASVEEEGHLYSVVNERPITPQFVEQVIGALAF